MTNEIPQALARNNGLFGRLEAVQEVVVVELVEGGGGGAKTGFQPLQLSRLSLLVLRLTPGSTLQPRGSRGCVLAHVGVRAFVCVCLYVRASRAPRDTAR